MTTNAELLAQLTARPAERRDLSAMLALITDDVLGQNRDLAARDDDPAYANAFDLITNDGNQVLLVGEWNRELIAMLQMTYIPGLSRRGALRANIEVMRVKGTLRSRGIGGWLMADAMARARARGCSLMQLTSDAQRHDAHAFYERLGFAKSHIGFKLKL